MQKVEHWVDHWADWRAAWKAHHWVGLRVFLWVECWVFPSAEKMAFQRVASTAEYWDARSVDPKAFPSAGRRVAQKAAKRVACLVFQWAASKAFP